MNRHALPKGIYYVKSGVGYKWRLNYRGRTFRSDRVYPSLEYTTWARAQYVWFLRESSKIATDRHVLNADTERTAA